MKLNFLGRGAAFNPKEGNISAYFTIDNQLFLIDCGESVFAKLMELDLLNNMKKINLMITHTHSDHIGSLGNLIMYAYYQLHRPLNIILPEKAKYLENINDLLKVFGCTKEMYNFVIEKEFDEKYEEFQNIRYIETSHCDELASYGLLFNTKEGIIYYSGDTKDLNVIKTLINSENKISSMYIDTTTANYPGNVHLYIGLLAEIIPNNLKEKVYCMHFNNYECILRAKELGFNVVEMQEEKRISLNKNVK